MTTNTEGAKEWIGQQFIIKRSFAAPRQMVFEAWTDAKQLAQWWGPRGFTNPVCEWEAKPGKAIYVVMAAPNGARFPMSGEFREIVPPERIVFTTGALDEKGDLMFEFTHTATFAEREGKTDFTLRSVVTKAQPDVGRYLGGFEAGMTQSLEKLEALMGQPGVAPLVVERLLDAPVAAVWSALVEKEKIKHWSFDLKEFKAEVGFEFEFSAEKGDVTFVHRCKVVEAIPNRKLAYSWRYAGHEGDSLVTIELAPEGDKTRLKLTHAGLETFPQGGDFDRKNFEAGWTQIIGRFLKEFVESKTADREIVMSREFDAPRHLVWDAFTDPKQIVQWWGPRGFSDTIEVMDLRAGGLWKHTLVGPDGKKYPNEGLFQEVVKPERIVYQHGGRREGGPSVSAVATWTFDEVCGNRTKVTIRLVFPTAENRDFVVKEFDAINGGNQTLEKLGEYLTARQD